MAEKLDFQTFHACKSESEFIEFVREKGLGYGENDSLDKNRILRLALAYAFKLPKISINSKEWDKFKITGEKNTSSFDLRQLTGKGLSKNTENFDELTRAMLYMQHKDEFDKANIDIFSDDKAYMEILSKYLRRGLFEMQKSWQKSEDFYAWALRNLNPQGLKQSSIKVEPKDYFSVMKAHFSKAEIEINLIKEKSSYKHYVYKIALDDSQKIKEFLKEGDILKDVLGCESVLVERSENEAKTYNIQISKSPNQRENLGKAEFKKGLKALDEYDYKLGVFAGMDIEGVPFCFDLAKCPHAFVAGKSGSGKTVFLQSIIACLLQNEKAKILVIDPKGGIDFKVFLPHIELVKDMEEVQGVFESLINLMKERNEKMEKAAVNSIEQLGFDYQIVIIDELNNLLETNKVAKNQLTRLAEMARQAGIHLVLGTQRPDGMLLKGLRNNIDGKIALKVERAKESEIILDKKGAENLLGNGDALIKVEKNSLNTSKITHIFGVKLENSDILELLSNA